MARAEFIAYRLACAIWITKGLHAIVRLRLLNQFPSRLHHHRLCWIEFKLLSPSIAWPDIASVPTSIVFWLGYAKSLQLIGGRPSVALLSECKVWYQIKLMVCAQLVITITVDISVHKERPEDSTKEECKHRYMCTEFESAV